MRELTKKIATILALIFLLILVIYLSFSLSVKNLIYDIYNSNGKYSSVHIKDQSIVKQINVRNSLNDEVKDFSAKEIKEDYHIWLLPFVNFLNGKIHYIYSYRVSKNGDLILGSSQIPVTLTIKWENLNWIIVDYYEPP